MPTSSSSSPGPLLRALLRLAEADLDRLGDLLADATDRVERVHRALEDDADLAPAVATQLVLGLGHEVDAEQLDAAALADPGVGRQQPDQRQRRRGLAAAGLPGQPERLAVVEPEAHAVDRLDPARLELEVRPQVLDHQQRGARIGLLRQRPLAPSADRREVGRVAQAGGPGRALGGERLLGERSASRAASGSSAAATSSARRSPASRSSSRGSVIAASPTSG